MTKELSPRRKKWAASLAGIAIVLAITGSVFLELSGLTTLQGIIDVRELRIVFHTLFALAVVAGVVILRLSRAR